MGMPGRSYRGALPPLTERQTVLRDALRRDVEKLAGEIGDRNIWLHEKLAQAAGFIERSLAAAGHNVSRQGYEAYRKTAYNIEAEIVGADKTRPFRVNLQGEPFDHFGKLPSTLLRAGRASEIVIIGAHYDTCYGTPGANDNASGVAALLALGRALAGSKPARTLRLVAFANEEPPFFQTDNMGSAVYARRCRERGENVVAMLSLETIGYYSDEEGSQRYPFPLNLFYPSTGNFIGFVGNRASRALVRQCVGSFRRHAQFPSEGAALPEAVPAVGLSDQWSFWRESYPALMLTDTAFLRYAHYHTEQDTPDKVKYDHLARVVEGLEGVVADLTISR